MSPQQQITVSLVFYNKMPFHWQMRRIVDTIKLISGIRAKA